MLIYIYHSTRNGSDKLWCIAENYRDVFWGKRGNTLSTSTILTSQQGVKRVQSKTSKGYDFKGTITVQSSDISNVSLISSMVNAKFGFRTTIAAVPTQESKPKVSPKKQFDFSRLTQSSSYF